jgi:hypothetical protein
VAANVSLNLKKRGFDCTGPSQSRDVWQWRCKLGGESVLVEGFGPERIRRVEAQAAGASTASAFLGYVATLPYEGSDSANAQGWVEAELPKLTAQSAEVTTSIGGARFVLLGPPEAATLVIRARQPGE